MVFTGFLNCVALFIAAVFHSTHSSEDSSWLVNGTFLHNESAELPQGNLNISFSDSNGTNLHLPDIAKVKKWQCPNIANTKSLECGCDIPHTLRCSSDVHGLEALTNILRASPFKVSLLDCTLRNVTFLSRPRVFENLTLHGLVISSGEMKRIHKLTLAGLNRNLQALGFPSNNFAIMPTNAISYLTSLERFDISNNRVEVLSASDFQTLGNLTYLDLSDNLISKMSNETFSNLKSLKTLRLGGNRLGDHPVNFQAFRLCYNLRELNIRSNVITGSLTPSTLPKLKNLEILNLERNLIRSVQKEAFDGFVNLKSLHLSHNQIDVLQDHAFYNLKRLEFLDLSYNGIVAVSNASLQHLTYLKTLDLTHNFLRALTSDLISPLPSLESLMLGGNDISIIVKCALDDANNLVELSLDENPLACDCSIHYFTEWLRTSKITTNNFSNALCATPPHLEGAPLSEVGPEFLLCDADDFEDDNVTTPDQIETIHHTKSLANTHDFSERIFLSDLHFSSDYGLILTWTVNLQDDYTCDAMFVYKEENSREILIDDSMIHCERERINGENTINVIVPNSYTLLLEERYRFCLVLISQKNLDPELEIGCSNVTKLQTNEQSIKFGKGILERKPNTSLEIQTIEEKESIETEVLNSKIDEEDSGSMQEKNPIYGLCGNINNYLPGIYLGATIATISLFLWGISKIRKISICSSISSTRYFQNPADPTMDHERGSGYSKLQASTTL